MGLSTRFSNLVNYREIKKMTYNTANLYGEGDRAVMIFTFLRRQSSFAFNIGSRNHEIKRKLRKNRYNSS